MLDPIPPGHGEPENVGASPGDTCVCGRPRQEGRAFCPCGRHSACFSRVNPHRPKRTFRSAAAARKYVRHNDGSHRGRYPYLCDDCGRWHLSATSSPWTAA